MIKFILHGGFHPGAVNEDNTDFYSEILKDTPDSVRILLVIFVAEESRWERIEKRVKNEFDLVRGNKNIIFEIATEDNFFEQIKNSDIVYLNGGELKKALKLFHDKFPNLGDMLGGKVIAGESFGSNILSCFFYSAFAEEVFEGLGVLPIRLIPHYTEDKKEKLKGYGDDLETLFLKEYEFKVVYK